LVAKVKLLHKQVLNSVLQHILMKAIIAALRKPLISARALYLR
jgi:hypothetical protein